VEEEKEIYLTQRILEERVELKLLVANDE